MKPYMHLPSCHPPLGFIFLLQVLPAVYLFVGRSLNATPVQLGTLTLCRAMVQVRGLHMTCTLPAATHVFAAVVQQQHQQAAQRVLPLCWIYSTTYKPPFIIVLSLLELPLLRRNPLSPLHHVALPPSTLVFLLPCTSRSRQTLSSPLSGILGDRYDRILVLSTGAFIWAIMTSAMALTVTLRQVRCWSHLSEQTRLQSMQQTWVWL